MQGTLKPSEASRVTVTTNGSIVRTVDSSIEAAAPYLVSGMMEVVQVLLSEHSVLFVQRMCVILFQM